MKLEIKHLSPYLPYGLKIANKSIKKSEGILSVYIMEINNDNDKGIENVLFGANQIPILRPLSDLTKEEKKEMHSRHPNLPNYQEFYEEFVNEKGLNLSETIIEYAAMEFLIENHFDVFGLIEKGLAININEL